MADLVSWLSVVVTGELSGLSVFMASECLRFNSNV